ncbi:MAG: diaminopimelate decarboxylase, partial [Thiotrichales bacterium]|nr:diaminopimelate decarboxylase [Thiotrichales bacterium]
MQSAEYRNGVLCFGNTPLTGIADEFGTPVFVYSRQLIEQQWQAFDTAFTDTPHLICYAVKANSNLAILNLLARLGSGFDIVSAGELERVLRAGGDPAKIVFSGVGKRHDEIERALHCGIHCFNVESQAELERINRIAADMDSKAPVSLRVNPDVDANTHPYIATGLTENKFGVDFHQALEIYRQAATMTHVEITGIDCHIGSQITELTPFRDALERILGLVTQLRDDGIAIRHIDFGGGLGIAYDDTEVPLPQAYVEMIK